MLGGSTGINGLAWSKPHTFQLDGLEQVGNAGVNWDSLEGYVGRPCLLSLPLSYLADVDIPCLGARR